MTEIEDFFRKLSEELDIPEVDYDRAEKRYHDIGEWLQRVDSIVTSYGIDIHPQGSFALGTLIRPFDKESHYDIDLVCQCDLDLGRITQKKLKDDVGYEVFTYGRARGIKKEPDEGRRNWTLEYADEAQFHMDILPAVPDQRRLGNKIEESYNFESAQERSQLKEYSEKAIAITDNEHYAYGVITKDWLSSNPVGYRNWFFEQMKVAHRMLTESRAQALNANIEDIPKHTVKTPLQRVVQILKRHRDVMFGDDDDKPISIIITTLAAKSYDNSTSLINSIRSIVFGMRDHIQVRGGTKWVANPVNPLENFADKWPMHPKREENFYLWLDKVEEDFNALLHLGDVQFVAGMLNESYGSDAVKPVLTRMGKSLMPVAAANRALDVPHRQQMPWLFRNQFDVTILASYYDGGFRKTPFKSGAALSKGLKLEFHAHTDAKKVLKRGKLQYYWQVVNTGLDAERAHSLRGEIFEGRIEKGRAKRIEETLYQGKHWIECFVIHDGVCVGRSGEFIVAIK